MVKTLQFTVLWYLLHNRRHVKVFKKCFHGVQQYAGFTGSTNQPDFWKQQFCSKYSLESLKQNSFLFFAVISARSCFYVCICLIIRFVYLVYFCFSAMIFSIFHLSIVNIYCCLYCTPGVYIKSPMLFLHSSYLHLFSKKTLDSLVSDLRVLWLNDLLGFSFCSFNFVSRIT